jgi:hypothetical protein
MLTCEMSQVERVIFVWLADLATDQGEISLPMDVVARAVGLPSDRLIEIVGGLVEMDLLCEQPSGSYRVHLI